MYPFVVKVKYWDDYHEPWELKKINILLYAEDFTDAANKIEHRYVDNIEYISVSAVADEGMFFEVPEEIADALIAGEGDYSLGVKKNNNAENM